MPHSDKMQTIGCRSGFTEMSFYSEDEDLPLGPEQIRNQLHEFWKAKIGTPVVVMGASLGGTVALDFAAAYPEARHRCSQSCLLRQY